MRAKKFSLHRPRDLAEAIALKVEHGDAATFHAGGTELLVALKAHVLRYEHVIDIKQIPGLKGVKVREDGTISIGALTTHDSIANDPVIRASLPGYAELSEHVANIRVRIAGTLGGVLCFAEPHADAPTMLCALDAWVVLAGPAGTRDLPSRDFHLGEFSTARGDDELLASIEIAPQSAGTRSAYRAFGHTERPAVGVAAVWSTDNPQRLSLWAGAITDRPTRLGRAEEAAATFFDQPPADLSAEEVWRRLRPAVVADALDINAHDDLHGGADYKRHLVSVLAERALKACLP
ncbi:MULTISPECIES: xanthine dehydrogenase family protein subunit M [unclassified Achromobacter]|uniref:FAD binding domain-containing protein n=1 Tax=unclassified Achromobacter TaxID=2626865 RepID=UPI000B5183CD|nr:MULTISPECIES: FAD binding domain-containing protein [unclassified Achromobacter]OWT73675.1 carbon monoxide dehydrogenase [Achromobacter sp. HZ34]OWT79409.1 carbon monoxide dehydrogenase [Achromobacter sp. HZ28]